MLYTCWRPCEEVENGFAVGGLEIHSTSVVNVIAVILYCTWPFMGGDLAPSLWATEKNFADQIFEWPFLGKDFNKFHFNAEKFWWPYFVCLLPASFTVWNNITLWPFSWRKTSISEQKIFLHDTFLSDLVLCHASNNNTTSRNIRGTDARAVSPPQIMGDRPSSPL